MNPSFTAMQKAWAQTMSNLMYGRTHVPKKDVETSINGRAFAPGKGVQQMLSSEEKEVIVQAHLDKLAAEARGRANGVGSPPSGDEADDRTKSEILATALNNMHTAYIDRRIALNRVEFRRAELKAVQHLEPKYPTSDLVDALREHIAEIDAHTVLTDRIEWAAKACIHTGEAINLEEHRRQRK